MRDLSTSGQNKRIQCCGADLPGQNGARSGVFRARNKQKATTVGLGKYVENNSEQKYSNSFTGTYLLWMLGWAHIISARAFNESLKRTNNLKS